VSCRALRIDHADDRQNQQPLAHLQHWCGQLPDRFLLLPDDALALFHESDATVFAMRFRGGS